MAANYTEEERQEFKRIIVEYYINNKEVSSRKIKEELNLPISHVTIQTYINELKKYNTQIKEIEQEKQKKYTEERTMKCIELYLNKNMTIEQIKEELNESYWTIYRDLTTRLNKQDKEKYEQYKTKTKIRMKNNLKK